MKKLLMLVVTVMLGASLAMAQGGTNASTDKSTTTTATSAKKTDKTAKAKKAKKPAKASTTKKADTSSK